MRLWGNNEIQVHEAHDAKIYGNMISLEGDVHLRFSEAFR